MLPNTITRIIYSANNLSANKQLQCIQNSHAHETITQVFVACRSYFEWVLQRSSPIPRQSSLKGYYTNQDYLNMTEQNRLVIPEFRGKISYKAIAKKIPVSCQIIISSGLQDHCPLKRSLAMQTVKKKKKGLEL